MRKSIALLLCMLLVSPSVAAAKGKRDPAEDAYEAARRAYYALKDDAKRRSLRHNWINVAEKFDAVARKYPKSDRAPDALYTAAELRADLSRVSMLNDDLRAAIETYERLITKYPKDNLADDAGLALARIHVDRTGDTEKARRAAERALKDHPKGDARKKLVTLLATIPHTPSAPAQGKRIVARTTPAPTARESSASEPVRSSSGAKDPSGRSDGASAHGSAAAASAGTTSSGSASPATASAAGVTSTQGSSTSAPNGSSSTAPSNSREALAEAIARASKPPGSGTQAPASPRAEERKAASSDTPAHAGELDDSDAHFSEPPMLEASVESVARAGESNDRAATAHADQRVAAQQPDASPASGDSRPMSAKEARKLASVVKAGEDELTLAEQLGLKVRRVVIDAGHGGHDTGAIGKKGTREKDVTLAIARRVGEILADRGLEVILTRDDDTFVRLEDRTRIANEAKGDLFISIHCNASESRKVRGTETFTLNVAADRYSIRLAARENASSEKSVSDLQFILADLATKANTDESQRLAKRVQQSLVTGLRKEYSGIKDLGTKQALFYVLLGAKMPAILVETAFLSNPDEEKLLASKEFQEKTALGIADGVQAFLDDRGRLAQID